MSEIIRGSRPRTFPVGVYQSNATLKKVYADLHVGKIITVPEGLVLVVPEHGGWESPKEVRREFPAGTRFRLLLSGDPHTLSVTEILDGEVTPS